VSATAASRLIPLMSASLDGFLARGPGDIDWLAEPGEVAEAAGDARHAANLELLGQVRVPERKEAGEGDIVLFGGARIAHSLARHRLIDEYRLTVHPVALGEGRRLFEHLGSDHIELEPVRALEGAGVTHLRYRVSHARSNSRISAG